MTKRTRKHGRMSYGAIAHIAWDGSRGMGGYKTCDGFCNLLPMRKNPRAKYAHRFFVAEISGGKIYGRNLTEDGARNLAESLRRDFMADVRIYARKI